VYAFRVTGTKDITITLGAAAPTLGYDLFFGVESSKTVTVKVPSGATAWRGKTGTFSGSNTALNWGNGFRGGGWTNSGTFYYAGGESKINSNISLTIQYE
jgi:hypothetical protein